MTDFALIVNPVSGRGKGPPAAARVKSRLESAGHAVRIQETRAAGDAARLAGAAVLNGETVVAVGGDGTLREVVEGTGPDTRIGLIPAGTANVLARDLGVPRDPERAACLLLEGTSQPVDMGWVNGRPFLAMVGVGQDADVVRRLAERRNGPIRMSSYVLPSIETLFGYRYVTLDVEIDGEPLDVPVYGVIVSNTANYGGIFSVTPDADATDGWLDWQCVVQPGRGAVLGWSMAAIRRRKAGPRLARYGRARRVVVTADDPAPVQVDGDPFGMTPVSIEIAPGRVSIILPARETAVSTRT